MTTLTDELADTLAASIANGVTAVEAIEACGLSRSIYHEWMSVAETGAYRDGRPASATQKRATLALVEKLARARASRYKVLVGSLYHNATTKNAKTGWFDTQAADKLLSKSPDTRETWHELKEVQQSGTMTTLHEHRLVRQIAEADGLPGLQAARAQLLEQHPELAD